MTPSKPTPEISSGISCKIPPHIIFGTSPEIPLKNTQQTLLEVPPGNFSVVPPGTPPRASS